MLPWAAEIEDPTGEVLVVIEGMKELYHVYKLLGWIQPVKNLSNKLVILRK